MKVYIGIIEHKHGRNLYAGLTPEARDKQMASYCREWWSEEVGDQPIPESDSEIIDAYINASLDEYLYREELEAI